MFWEVVFGILSIAIGIVCGIYTWCSLMKDNTGADYINPLTALLIAVFAAILGYFYGLFALFAYFFAKILMGILWCVADIIDFIYVAYFSKKYNSYKRKAYSRHAQKRLNVTR